MRRAATPGRRLWAGEPNPLQGRTNRNPTRSDHFRAKPSDKLRPRACRREPNYKRQMGNNAARGCRPWERWPAHPELRPISDQIRPLQSTWERRHRARVAAQSAIFQNPKFSHFSDQIRPEMNETSSAQRSEPPHSPSTGSEARRSAAACLRRRVRPAGRMEGCPTISPNSGIRAFIRPNRTRMKIDNALKMGFPVGARTRAVHHLAGTDSPTHRPPRLILAAARTLRAPFGSLSCSARLPSAILADASSLEGGATLFLSQLLSVFGWNLGFLRPNRAKMTKVQ